MADKNTFGFPFVVNDKGSIDFNSGDEAIRGKIIQVLFTSPGERVNMPEFGCGLRDLVFEPNNPVLAATTEYTVRKALDRWLADDILVETVDVANHEEKLFITITYIRKDRLEKQAIKISF